MSLETERLAVQQVSEIMSAMIGTVERISRLERALISIRNQVKVLKVNVTEKQFIHCFRMDDAGGSMKYVPITTILDEIDRVVGSTMPDGGSNG